MDMCGGGREKFQNRYKFTTTLDVHNKYTVPLLLRSPKVRQLLFNFKMPLLNCS